MFLCSSQLYHNLFDYKTMSMIFGVVYVTTMLHWHKVQDGLIKKIDIGVSLLTIYRLTCVERLRLKPLHQTYWLYVVGIMATAFIINEYIFYMQVKCPSNDKRCIRMLDYTYPDTIERERACYGTVFRHIWFIHLLPTFAFGWFVVNNFANTCADSINTPLL